MGPVPTEATRYADEYCNWGITCEKQVKWAGWPIADVDYYNFRFEGDGESGISHLLWRHGPNTESDAFLKGADV